MPCSFKPLLPLLLALLAPAPAAAQEWAARLQQPGQTEHDFGRVEVGQVAEHTFTLTNPFRYEIVLGSISFSDDCGWQATPSRQRLAPGETCELVVRFNSRRLPGRVEGRVRVSIDEPFRGEAAFPIRGEVLGEYQLDPGQIDFGLLPQGVALEQRITVTRYCDPRWRIGEILSTNPHVEVTAGEVTTDHRATSCTLTVRLSAEAPPGQITGNIVLRPADERDPELRIRLRGQINEGLTAAPYEVELGTLAPGQVETRQIMVQGPEAFRIHRAQSSDRQLEAAFEWERREVHVVTVTFTAGDTPGPFRHAVEIETTLGDDKITCHVSGEILPPPSAATAE